MAKVPDLPVGDDKWGHFFESAFVCSTCVYYLNFRCRRHAPGTVAIQGWPAVFSIDWCGDHKIKKETMKAMTK